jgi:hypothetical protein
MPACLHAIHHGTCRFHVTRVAVFSVWLPSHTAYVLCVEFELDQEAIARAYDAVDIPTQAEEHAALLKQVY